jgi:hypothetical protein
MAVRVQGNTDGGVTEALADSFGSGHTSTADLLEVFKTSRAVETSPNAGLLDTKPTRSRHGAGEILEAGR